MLEKRSKIFNISLGILLISISILVVIYDFIITKDMILTGTSTIENGIIAPIFFVTIGVILFIPSLIILIVSIKKKYLNKYYFLLIAILLNLVSSLYFVILTSFFLY